MVKPLDIGHQQEAKGCGTVSRHHTDVVQWLMLLVPCCQVDRIWHHLGDTSVHIFEGVLGRFN